MSDPDELQHLICSDPPYLAPSDQARLDAVLSKIADNLATELRYGAQSVAAIGKDLDPMGGSPFLIRRGGLLGLLKFIRILDQTLTEELIKAGVIPPAPKEIKRK